MKTDGLSKKIEGVFERSNGVIFANSALKSGLSRYHLARLAKNGVLEHAARGVYIKQGEISDELFAVQRKAQRIIYSHETALFLYGLSDRCPIRHSITVPSTYNASAPIKRDFKIYHIKPELFELGKTKISSGMGNEVECYSLERTICDIMRSRSRIEAQIFSDALKKYASRSDANLNLLAEYAKEFSVYKLLRPYLEVLL